MVTDFAENTAELQSVGLGASLPIPLPLTRAGVYIMISHLLKHKTPKKGRSYSKVLRRWETINPKGPRTVQVSFPIAFVDANRWASHFLEHSDACLFSANKPFHSKQNDKGTLLITGFAMKMPNQTYFIWVPYAKRAAIVRCLIGRSWAKQPFWLSG